MDTRHHTFKIKPQFPREWRMTEDRKRHLTELRSQAYLLDSTKKTEGALIDGRARIRQALAPPADEDANLEEKLAELLTVNAPRRR